MSTTTHIVTTNDRPRPALHALAAFPIACFTCALLTDIAYVQTANILWADFSAWLLAAGMVGAVFAAIAGLIAWVSVRRGPTGRPLWLIAFGALVVLTLGLLNNLVHSRDGWTSVMPLGLMLSAVTVLVMILTVWLPARARRRIVTSRYAGTSA